MSLHIGITPWDLGSAHTAHWLAEQAAFAEQLGFDSFFLPENHFTGRGAVPEPLMLLAAVAARTRRIRLGTTSLLLPVRHPLQTAEQVAVLDQLSEGRVILGLGRGFQAPLYRAFDVALADKRRVFAEVLALMQRAWRGESVVDGGEPVLLAPLPVQQPHPPLWVAAFGPKALAQTAGLGLPYLASPMETLDTLAANYASLAVPSAGGVVAGAADGVGAVTPGPAQAHPDGPGAVPVMRTVFVAEDANEVARVRSLLAAPAPVGTGVLRRAADVSVDDWAIIGTPEEVRARIETYRARIGMTHLIATRLRVPGVDSMLQRRSLTLLAGLR
jgi:alkanesulfonate monooxygenase SsuD/methylene tetrahydromethanopterin reductase-like flavin-dependent oxidoreductase (luciferase family)